LTLPFVTDEQVTQLMGTPPRWDVWGPATQALYYKHALRRIGQVLGEEAANHVHLLAGCCSHGMERASNHLTMFNTRGVDSAALIVLAKKEQAGGKP